MSKFLTLKQYIKKAELLVKSEYPKFANDEDVISKVVELMAKADEIFVEGSSRCSRDTFRYYYGRYGLLKAINHNYNPRYIQTRRRRTEVLNHPIKFDVELDECQSSFDLSDKLLCVEIRDYIETLPTEIKRPFIEYYFNGNSIKGICEILGIGRWKLNKLLEEGLVSVREKFKS